MTALVACETVLLVLLSILVVGLLRCQSLLHQLHPQFHHLVLGLKTVALDLAGKHLIDHDHSDHQDDPIDDRTDAPEAAAEQ